MAKYPSQEEFDSSPFKKAGGVNCIDCGKPVEKPGEAGSARCESCWEDRCGGAGESEL